MQEIQGFRLSPQQARLWRRREDGMPAGAQATIDLAGQLDRAALRRALQAVAERHDILRTRFRRTPGVRLPLQIPGAGEVDVREVDLAGCAPCRQPAAVDEVVRLELRAAGDLDRDLPLRAVLVALGARRHLLVLTLPGLCADARSFLNLFGELAAAYAAPGRAAIDEVVQYLQFAEWQNELQGAADATPAQMLRHRPEPNPGGRPMLPFAAAGAEGPGNEASLGATLEPALAERIDALARRLAVAAEAVLLAAWMAFLRRVTGDRGVTVACSSAGRGFAELAGSLGPFASRLPVHCMLDLDTPFAEAVARAAQAVLEAESWQGSLPPEGGEGAGSGPAFGFELIELPPAMPAGVLRLALAEVTIEGERAALELSCRRRDGALAVRLGFDRRQISETYGRCLRGQLLTFLASVCGQPEGTLRAADLLDPAERERLVVRFNATRRDVPAGRLLHQLVAQWAARAPQAVAIEWPGANLTYGQLDAAANRLARYLRRLGVGCEERVPVCLGTSPEMVIALLAVLKAGGAYVPLDAGHPGARLRRILDEVRPRFVLTAAPLAATLGDHCRTVLVDLERPRIEAESASPPPELAGPANLAYVLYTSGSTGAPKGVMVAHQALVNYLSWCLEAYGLEAGTGAPLHSPITFDLTVTSLFGPLAAGRTVQLIPDDRGIEGLAGVLSATPGFSLIKLTPSHLAALAHLLAPAAAAGRARALVIGGEALFAEQIAFWRANAPDTRLINEYGPTETVVGCSVYEVSRELPAVGPVPIGRPIGNARIYVLDGDLRPQPVGLPGEIYIGGAGLARGYLGQPGATAARFVPDPFAATPGDRLYRSGDLARFRPDGELEYLGRGDGQVKIRGHRVELGEVEAGMLRHPAVREAVAVLREDVPGDPRLVGYFTSPLPGEVVREELRSFLRGVLPEPMLPFALVPLGQLPLTANGKLDRAALRPPEKGRLAAYVAPRTEIERTIAAICQDVLHVDRIGLDDSFFDLGGHSLLMVQAYSRLRRELGTEVDMLELFEYPSVGKMADFLAGEGQAGAALGDGRERAEERRAAALERERRRQRRDVGLGEPGAGAEPR